MKTSALDNRRLIVECLRRRECCTSSHLLGLWGRPYWPQCSLTPSVPGWRPFDSIRVPSKNMWLMPQRSFADGFTLAFAEVSIRRPIVDDVFRVGRIKINTAPRSTHKTERRRERESVLVDKWTFISSFSSTLRFFGRLVLSLGSTTPKTKSKLAIAKLLLVLFGQ